MAPLPPNLTQRLFLHYTSVGRPHELCLRPTGVQDEATLETMAGDAATDLANFVFDTDSFFKAEYTGVGSNVRIPLVFTPVAGLASLAGNQYPIDPESVMISITGKGIPSGTRYANRFFTSYNYGGAGWPLKNRWQLATAPAGVLTFWNLFNVWHRGAGLAGVRLVSASSSPVIQNGYVNISLNAWWQRKQRTE